MRRRPLERRYSSKSVSNKQQSEVTERPPNLYRVPKINIPDNLHDVARLVQSELQKIEQSQSVMLSLWEKYQEQKTELVQARAQIQQLRTAITWAGIIIPIDD